MYLFTAAVLCLSFLPGCEQKAGQTSASGVQPEMTVAKGRDGDQAPYYYGLIEEYRTVLEGDPENLAAIIALGNAYFDSGHWRQAITMYDHALAIEPRNADVRADLGTAYRNLGLPDRALAEYRIALEHEPGHLDARYNMGIVYAYDKKNYRAAIHVWNEILKLAPNYPHADRIRENIAALQKALKRNP